MAPLAGWFGTGIGTLVVAAGLLMVIRSSPLAGAGSSIEEVYLWAVVFLAGVLVVGWGLGKLVAP